MADATTVPTSTDPNASLVSQFYDLFKSISGKTDPLTANAAAAADPFASQRGGYQKQLLGLLTNPGSFTTDPGYQFAKQQGLDAINASANAAGLSNSGNNIANLDKYATGVAEKAYDTRVNQLTTLSGATTGSPAAAGGILARDAAGTTAGGAQAISQILSALGMAPAAIQQFLKQFGGGSGSGLDLATGGSVNTAGGGTDTASNTAPGSPDLLPDSPVTAGGPDPGMFNISDPSTWTNGFDLGAGSGDWISGFDLSGG